MPNLGSYTIAFAPHVAVWLLWTLGAAAFALLVFSLFRRARGALARFAMFAILILALANPLAVKETREAITSVVALVADHSQSQSIATRTEDTDKALAELREKLKAIKGLEIREADVRSSPSEDSGTQIFGALNSALADVPPDRVAGAIIVTDGEAHDAPDLKAFAFPAPLHVLLSGAPGERDRKLTIVRAERFAIVGHNAAITVKVEDFGGTETGNADISVRVDGQSQNVASVPLGRETTIDVPVRHGGENVVEIEAASGPSEQTLQNNRAVAVINGVRDRLRVLLVSGEPHAGERVWRNLLKADPSVDLVHFTILRPPDKQDATPLNELSLIAFPTRQLFDERLSSFDLVIFDRYTNRGILPLAYFENIAHYVEEGGALLISAGPEFADFESIYRTPLAAVLPARPNGQVADQPFKPLVTEAGEAHPVTHGLPGANIASAPPSWGRWFRVVGAEKLSGTTVMEAPDHRPLLVLDRIAKGRVAELLSDQAWLWARGFEGGGPQAELLRRLAHWLMKEPDLEEEKLTAEIGSGSLVITRRTMAAKPADVVLTTPSGAMQTITLQQSETGRFTARVPANELGLYRMTDGTLSAVAAAGPLNPKEMSDMRATDAILKPFAEKTGGGVQWIKDGIPDLRAIAPDAKGSGNGWFGLERRDAYRVTSVESEKLLPPWLAVILLLGTMIFAWRREAK